MMSEGRVALSLTMFSASGAQASIATGIFKTAIATAAAEIAAAPAISDFIASMPSAGLRARPPVSKVIPLPTKAYFFFAFTPLG
ncbi:unannotated protein [freshwater metagenome]|uniref:Unannotated protein n=1 Tax=freshwater metagenome TaxID=449393 RepID=A0A6J5Z1R6_9ZZZZ